MANDVYTKGAEKMWKGEIDILTDTIKVALIKQEYVLNLSTHEFAADLVTAACALATPGTVTGTGSGTGGTLAAATYYVKVTAIDSIGRETAASAESSGVTTTGATSSIAYDWADVASAVSYRIYFGTTSGAQADYFTSATSSFTLTTTSGGTSGSPPSSPTTVTAIKSSVALSGRTVTGRVFDANDATFSAPAAGDTCEGVVIYKDTGVAGTSPLLFYIDDITYFPATTTGADITVQWSNGSYKIASL